MNRRNFVRNGLAAGALTGMGLGSTHGFTNTAGFPVDTYHFNLKYAPHFGMFKNHAGDDLVDQVTFMADVGFRALEDNGMAGRSVADQERIAREMERQNMEMGVFVINANNWEVSLTTGKQEYVDAFVNACKDAVEVAKRVNARWMTVVPGYYERRLPLGIQTANVIEVLRRGAEIFEPHGLTMVLEPLSDNPDLFLRYSDQTYMICKAVNSPSCKILYDIYHMQKNEGQLMVNMERTWDEIGYIQIGDNPGRKEPTTGEINYKNIFKWIHEQGYDGILGMEHGNAGKGKDGEQEVINAYIEVDQFKA